VVQTLATRVQIEYEYWCRLGRNFGGGLICGGVWFSVAAQSCWRLNFGGGGISVEAGSWWILDVFVTWTFVTQGALHCGFTTLANVNLTPESLASRSGLVVIALWSISYQQNGGVLIAVLCGGRVP
jgi:hypothetical protein